MAGLETTEEMFDLRMSQGARPLYEKVKAFIREEVIRRRGFERLVLGASGGVDSSVSLYLAADVMLVTPLRDGMNLIAKEFCASRVDERGVLVLSEFAGAADELTRALLVNPHDVDGVANAMERALAMPPAEQARRLRPMRPAPSGTVRARLAQSMTDQTAQRRAS